MQKMLKAYNTNAHSEIVLMNNKYEETMGIEAELTRCKPVSHAASSHRTYISGLLTFSESEYE